MSRPNSKPYPIYSRPERVADASIHSLGILGGLIGLIILVRLTQDSGPAAQIAVWIYGIALTGSFVASMAYHFARNEEVRPFYRRFDHAAIFSTIAATYTPLVVIMNTPYAYAILAIVWIVAIGGMVWKIAFWQRPNWKSILLYLSLGWGCLALAYPFYQTMPGMVSALAAAGGLTYSFGVIFYKAKSMRFNVAIWHGFVLAASACFFAAIYIAHS